MYPFDLDVYSGLEGDPAVSNLSRIGRKGETSFPYLKVTSKEASSSSGSRVPSSRLGTSTENNDNLQYVDNPESFYTSFSKFSVNLYTPPGSPGLPALSQILIPGGDTEIEEEKARALGSGFEIVDEFWDQDACRYKIAEFSKSKSKIGDESVKYPFVIRRQLGKPNTEPKCSINIESGGLRDIVLQALEYIGEEGITVDLDVLLSCLPQLEDRLAISTGFALASPAKSADAPGDHLKKLVEFLKPFREIITSPMTHSGEFDILSMITPVEVDMSSAMRPVEQKQSRSHSILEDFPGLEETPNPSSEQ